MGSTSFVHILVLIIIALIFFGPRRLPNLGSSIGKAIRGFKEGLNEIEVDPKDIHDQVTHKSNKDKKS
ncbi:twin-arginine translocase TatA/TatE family subunit [Bdellovibrio reynosensis]|uniref:Sec-independent protein translocase protein TatA n=1 Tax=Bdellovibrio reynosensis TaxID=2835041 RepID=A0ABY4CA93_9BACT|nr:twin-arginine translocase TatA/TatE family subunit [Bdellovibrio reynosensis]UOF01830.1 twin-arginine translocase TatA/TatE family subunit [Bdellovibrio reynosensis]